MPPAWLRLDPQRPDPAALAQAAAVLAAGGVAIFPSETLYGLAVDYRNAAALQRLAAIKGRDAAKPFPLILAAAAEADALAQAIGPEVRGLMARFWPGPLTLVLTARPGLDPRLVSAEGGVGLRLSPHPVAAGLASALGRAITATSANLSGRPAVSRAADLEPELVRGVDLVLDAGPTPGGPASTVLDCRAWPPRLLRPGAVPWPQPEVIDQP
ncbi:MAG: L-threonylcarbamoyladenylate synthase [Thermodesulfobacteriota bacterium]